MTIHDPNMTQAVTLAGAHQQTSQKSVTHKQAAVRGQDAGGIALTAASPPFLPAQLKPMVHAGVQAVHGHKRWAAFQVAAPWRLASAIKGCIELTALPGVAKPVSP